jgi:uncharacterized protein YegP (UPF0339 family)
MTKQARVKRPCFQLVRSADVGKYFWHLIGRNGEIICWSETYTTKRAAVMSIHRTIDICGQLAGREHIIEDLT